MKRSLPNDSGSNSEPDSDSQEEYSSGKPARTPAEDAAIGGSFTLASLWKKGLENAKAFKSSGEHLAGNAKSISLDEPKPAEKPMPSLAIIESSTAASPSAETTSSDAVTSALNKILDVVSQVSTKIENMDRKMNEINNRVGILEAQQAASFDMDYIPLDNISNNQPLPVTSTTSFRNTKNSRYFHQKNVDIVVQNTRNISEQPDEKGNISNAANNTHTSSAMGQVFQAAIIPDNRLINVSKDYKRIIRDYGLGGAAYFRLPSEVIDYPVTKTADIICQILSVDDQTRVTKHGKLISWVEIEAILPSGFMIGRNQQNFQSEIMNSLPIKLFDKLGTAFRHLYDNLVNAGVEEIIFRFNSLRVQEFLGAKYLASCSGNDQYKATTYSSINIKKKQIE